MSPTLAEGTGDGPAEDGDHQAEQRDGHDRRGDDEQPQRADGGQARLGRAAPRDAAELPDDRGQHEDDQAGDDVRLEHRAAEGRERDRGPRPGQRSALPGQARVAFLWVVTRLTWSGGRGHRRAETSRTTAAMTAIPVTVAARSHGRIDRGSGSPRRSARWLRTHSAYAATASTAPSTISGTPS